MVFKMQGKAKLINDTKEALKSMPPEEKKVSETTKGSFILQLDHSFHLKTGLKFAFTYGDDDESLGSSLCSGLRNSLHSSIDFQDLEKDLDGELSLGDLSFGDQEEVTNWREPPGISDSDWMLSIESIPSGNVKQYHVHKTVLVNGYKRGDYFVNLFGYQGPDREARLQTPIKIHEDAADFVPQMLDYMYSLDDNLEICSDTAAGLAHLSQFF